MSLQVLALAFDELAPRTAYDVWRLRQQVFVVEQDCPYPDLDGRDLEDGTRHVVLLDGNGPTRPCSAPSACSTTGMRRGSAGWWWRRRGAGAGWRR